MAGKTKRAALTLSEEQRTMLRGIAGSRTAPVREVERARILLGYADGASITELERQIGLSRPAVYRCIDKALAAGVAMGLAASAGLARGARGSDAGATLRVNPARGQQRPAQQAQQQARRLRHVVDVAAMHRMVALLYVYTTGFVMLELSEADALRRARHGRSKTLPPYVSRLISTGALPNIGRMLRELDGPPASDAAFEDGLELVFEGMAALLKTSR